ncbi:MAG: RES domain-containing protein [Gammaproteobacteria bacterium]
MLSDEIRPILTSDFQEIGDDWFDKSGVAVLWVPSLVSPYETNVLINQEHPDFRRIKV